ncbi:NAD(P)H-hydrate dehydratase [Yunchengibacter salinarum]|uniref:NAD(P)H-hydrate dehydratase n=1 Tax=Yunchengibacter salinarum TaxID=3133399 RepID=UPI0035B62590
MFSVFPTLLTPSESAKADSLATQSGVSGQSLMEAAGRGVAECALVYLGLPSDLSGPVVVVCGPGNNGGDGYVAARYLRDWGFDVRLLAWGDPARLAGDARAMYAAWGGPVLPAAPDALSGASVIIDALLGAGLSRPVDGEMADLVNAINAADAFRLAVDLPSGLDGETGRAPGACVRADATVTFFTRKPGHVLVPGRFYCGGNEDVHVVDIGIPPEVLDEIAPRCFENAPALWGGGWPLPGPHTYKYGRGHALVLGGREPALGACRLSSMAALRAGCGLVTLGAPSETYPMQATALTDVMVRKFEVPVGFLAMLSDPRISAVLLGPGAGVGEKTGQMVRDVIAKGRAVVLDADALTSMAGRVADLSTGEVDVVLTPHEGEFARLFPDLDPADRVPSARAAAQMSGAVVVLKGVDTVVAHPDGRVSINQSAPAWLSVAGTGDVLAGVITGLLAQGMSGFDAASAGVWLHGRAGLHAGRGLIASDLLGSIKAVLP